MAAEKSITQSNSENLDQSSYESVAKSVVDSSLTSAADHVTSMMENKSSSSSQDSAGICSLHDLDHSKSSSLQHTCRCSRLKVLREKAEKQIEVYKREKSYIHSIRESLDEQMRKESIRAYLEEDSEEKEKSADSSEPSSTSSFLKCTESCVSHKKPHYCSERKKQKQLQKSSNISTQTRDESTHADDEDSEIKQSLIRPSTRKSSKKPSMTIEATSSDDDSQRKTADSKGSSEDAENREKKQTIHEIAILDEEEKEILEKSSEKGRSKTDEIVRKTTVKERTKTSASDGELLEELAKSAKSKVQSEAILCTTDLIDNDDEARQLVRVTKRTIKKTVASKSIKSRTEAEHSDEEQIESHKSKAQSIRATSQKSTIVEKHEVLTSDDEECEKSKDGSRCFSTKTQVVALDDEEEILDLDNGQSRLDSIKSKAKTIASKAASVRQTQLKSTAKSEVQISSNENEKEESIEGLERQRTRAGENFKKKSEQKSERNSSGLIQFEEGMDEENERKNNSKKSSVRRPSTPISSHHMSEDDSSKSEDEILRITVSKKQTIGKSVKSVTREEEKMSHANTKSRQQTQTTEILDEELDNESRKTSQKSRVNTESLETPRRTSIKLKAFTLIHNDGRTSIDMDTMKVRSLISESKSKSVRQTKKSESDDVSSQSVSSSQDSIDSQDKIASLQSIKSKAQTMAYVKTNKEEQRKTSVKTVEKYSDDESIETESNESAISQSTRAKSVVSKKYEKSMKESRAQSRKQTTPEELSFSSLFSDSNSITTKNISASIQATEGKSEVSKKHEKSIRQTTLTKCSDEDESTECGHKSNIEMIDKSIRRTEKSRTKTDYIDNSAEEIEFEISLRMSAKAFTSEELRRISGQSRTSENDNNKMQPNSLKSHPKTAQAELDSSRDSIKENSQTAVSDSSASEEQQRKTLMRSQSESTDEANKIQSRAATMRSNAKSKKYEKFERQTTTKSRTKTVTEKPQQSVATLDSDDEFGNGSISHIDSCIEDKAKPTRLQSERKKTADEVKKPIHICTCALKYPELFKDLEKLSYKCQVFNEMAK